MGAQKTKRMKAGDVRPGPRERVPVLPGKISRERLRLHSQNERQARCRALRKERLLEELEIVDSAVLIDALEDREKRRIAASMYFACTEELLKCPGPLTRKDVLGKLLDKFHSELPDHILPMKQSAAQQQLVSGFQQALSEVKGSTASNLATRHALLTAAVSTGNISSVRQVAIALDVHPRNIRQALVRRRLMCETGAFLWTLSVRRKRMDGMTGEVKNAVLTWWVSETRVSPNKKDVTRKRIGPGLYDEKPTHYLMETQTAFFLRFKESHPWAVVGERSFGGMKPFFVKPMSERNTCCCIYHVELNELRLGVNQMRSATGAAQVCSHPLDSQGRCLASNLEYSGLTAMWESIVCPKGEHDEWHRAECLFGECKDCGIKLLPTCEDEIDGVGDRMVEWRRFAKEECRTKTGRVVQKLALVYKRTLPDELLEYMKPKLQHFVTHNFVARWEDQQFKACIKGFGKDSVVSVVDFAENYKFEIQNEVQSMHWHSYQISILVHISFRHNPEADPYDEDSWILTEYHFYISDDKNHDSLFVQYCFGLHWDYMKAQNFSPKMHYVWSDGCAAQFKSAKPWFFVSRYPNMTDGCGMLWSFFGSGHGKGPHDGAGAVVKCFIRREQLKSDGWRLQNATTVVNFLTQSLSSRPESSYMGRRKPMTRKFWNVAREDVEKLEDLDCDTIPGTRGLHSILATNRNHLTNLMVKKLACFCSFCFDGKWEECMNLKWTDAWIPKFLQPQSANYVRERMSAPWSNVWGCDASGETTLASTLDIGDNLAVNAAEGNSEGEDFWLINCTKTMHVVKCAFTCMWGTSFEVGDEIVVGMYYQRWGTSETSYVLLKNSHPVHMHAHLVRAVKFPMLPKDYRAQGNDMVYDLPASAWSGIKEVIACLHFDDD